MLRRKPINPTNKSPFLRFVAGLSGSGAITPKNQPSSDPLTGLYAQIRGTPETEKRPMPAPPCAPCFITFPISRYCLSVSAIRIKLTRPCTHSLRILAITVPSESSRKICPVFQTTKEESSSLKYAPGMVTTKICPCGSGMGAAR